MVVDAFTVHVGCELQTPLLLHDVRHHPPVRQRRPGLIRLI